MRLVVATRRSALALAQTRAFVASLCACHPGLEVEELHVVTSGDRIVDRPLAAIGGKGLFVKEIEEALRDGRADFAVHSMKDLPAELAPDLVLAAIPQRADPRDVLLVAPGHAPNLTSLPRNARVGTSSTRRQKLLLAQRPDLQIEPLRGNVDTRLRKLNEGLFDAVVLAAAGLARLGLDPSSLPPHAPLSIEEMLPAVTQGILAIEARADATGVRALLAVMTDRQTELRAHAERAVLRALEADCTVPLAAYSDFVASPTMHQESMQRMHLGAWLDEGTPVRAEESALVTDVSEAQLLGARVGRRLRDAARGLGPNG